MKTKQLLEEIDRFSDRSSPFDTAFHLVVEAIQSVQQGTRMIEAGEKKRARVCAHFEQAQGFLAEAKNMFQEGRGLSPELRSVIDRYARFCDRMLTEI